ncbi:hypothetical protein LGR54_24695 [Ancylobacter sp. Lp-2]|uniref:hypothetical protein n=1 Tax=Ancylobacter sp. Lp-2 TaxID=2881339 RepID=UPI001E38678C|nr:hypothetical protein [Ancylobacter sp. Lp-2]MCB4771815.1 hypothetical protein [Ancylobacter sp. Lp-2]
MLQKISDIKAEVEQRQWHTATYVAKMLELEVIDAIRASREAGDVGVKPDEVRVTHPPEQSSS